MIDKVLSNRWTTAQDLFHDQKLNIVGASVDTIQRMLTDEGLNACRPTIVPEISE